ncbi:cytochrome P450 [Nocardia sp. NPDC003482]
MASRSTELDGLPHAPGRLPILGDITSVDRKRPTQHELKLAQDGLGPIFQRQLLRDRLVIVSGARLATQTCDETHWGRALVGPGAVLRRIVPDGLFTARSSDPLWGQARRILTPGFAQAAMRTYHDAMQTVADDLLSEWATTGSIDVHSAMTRATLEVIGRAGFSRDLDLFHDGPDSADSRRFVTALAEVLQWASETTNDLPIIGALRSRLRASSIDRNVRTVRDYVDRVIAARTANPDTEAHDLLSVMLTTTDPETGQPLSADNIASQVLTFLIAGHETTAALLEVALHYLAADPDLQDELRDEHRGRGGFDYDAVTGMRLTRGLLNECLRLWPPLPGFFRVARSDQILGGYRVPAGRAVLVLALAAHRDPDVWGADAAEFDPHRFDTDRLRQHPDRFFQPWGTGPRSCIGRQFALHEASLLLARILDAYTLTGAGAPLTMQERGTLRPEPYDLKVLART